MNVLEMDGRQFFLLTSQTVFVHTLCATTNCSTQSVSITNRNSYGKYTKQNQYLIVSCFRPLMVTSDPKA